MAIFGKKEKKDVKTAEKEKKAAVPKAAKVPAAILRGTNAAILRAPRITEKASFAQERGVYVFTVLPRATKADIGRAVFEIYGVRPRKIHIAQIPSKLVYSARRRKPGIKVGGKKAYVYLRAGEKIEVV